MSVFAKVDQGNSERLIRILALSSHQAIKSDSFRPSRIRTDAKLARFRRRARKARQLVDRKTKRDGASILEGDDFLGNCQISQRQQAYVKVKNHHCLEHVVRCII